MAVKIKVPRSLVLVFKLKERQHFSRVFQWSEMADNLSTVRFCFSFPFSLVILRKLSDQGKVISGAEHATIYVGMKLSPQCFPQAPHSPNGQLKMVSW